MAAQIVATNQVPKGVDTIQTKLQVTAKLSSKRVNRSSKISRRLTVNGSVTDEMSNLQQNYADKAAQQTLKMEQQAEAGQLKLEQMKDKADLKHGSAAR